MFSVTPSNIIFAVLVPHFNFKSFAPYPNFVVYRDLSQDVQELNSFKSKKKITRKIL